MKKLRILTVVLLTAMLIISGCSSTPYYLDQGNNNQQEGIDPRIVKEGKDYDPAIPLELHTPYVVEGGVGYTVKEIKMSDTNYKEEKEEGYQNLLIKGEMTNLQKNSQYPNGLLECFIQLDNQERGGYGGRVYIEQGGDFTATSPLAPQMNAEFVINIRVPNDEANSKKAIKITILSPEDRLNIYKYDFR